MTYTPLVDKLLCNPFWKNQDDFPAHPEWKEECEKWLKFIERHNQLNRFWPRLTKQNAKQRDKAFTEIKAAYFMEVIKGYPIKEWEPNGQDKTKGDFLIDVNGTKVFCEVKSPSWESELSEEEKKNERKKEGKYVEKAEVRSFATWEKIRFTIEKAYRQLPSDVPTLLIIIDDLFCPILATPANQIDIALYSETTLYGERRGFFYDKEFCNLSGILFLNVHKYLDKHEVEYRSQFKKNGHVNFDLEISV